MFSVALLAALHAGLSAALPAPASFFPELMVREVQQYNASLPNITIYATGGTIAGSAASSDQTTGYQAGALGVDILLQAVPQLYNVSNPRGVQFANVGSTEITPAILVNLTQHIQKELDSPYCQGVVVTHGTDTLEETAFFLDLTVRTEKPIVVVGAMRPATAISADGPINLLEAVTLAADPAARGRGAMVVLNDRIASAYYVTKTNSNSLDTFKAVEQGYLGFFYNIKPRFFFQPTLPLGRPYFDVSATPIDGLPQVDILYGYQGLNPALAKGAVDAGAKGLVVAGPGAGSWTRPGTAAIREVAAKGTPVVFSRRSENGFVGDRANNTFGAGLLNPQKSRIMLQLALNAGYEEAQLSTLFEF
ncbi:L-asparaginase [Microdochium trichocladiopsis]|uniref:asparaginase n=1 Tax=Microdochium trichocladiopsis TaxID=1682393 RepID=A0A9P8XS41_9PEZI|nr:L-asparaginase [Microdochium trichocladiopsis]KAH7014393.1 L-asparaginase [Microdochium trichocladiopsis]